MIDMTPTQASWFTLFLNRWKRRHESERNVWRVGPLSWMGATKARRTPPPPNQQRQARPQNLQNPPTPRNPNSNQKQNHNPHSKSNKNRTWTLQTAAWQEVTMRKLRRWTCTSFVPMAAKWENCVLRWTAADLCLGGGRRKRRRNLDSLICFVM